jgi:hypothetical protein
MLKVVGAKSNWHQHLNITAQQFSSVVPKNLLGLGIDEDYFSNVIGHNHSIGGRFQMRPKSGL